MKPFKKAVFLDRDGVLNQVVIKNGKPYPPATLQDLVIPEEVAPALQRLQAAGFMLIVVTNQPDVARGKISKEKIEAINTYLKNILPLDDILICFHDDEDNCDCRKPLPGLLLQAAKRYQIDLRASFMIGDRWRDVEAGQRADCRTVWLDYDYAEKKPINPADYKTASLTAAVDWIITY